MKKGIFKKENRGFALLFSVLVSSLLLTIGLSIFSITLKELSISTATRQSIYAFYAADSGREYAKYRDTKLGNFPDVSLKINDQSFNFSTSTSMSVADDDGPFFTVKVEKIKPNDGSCDVNAIICTHITSQGYDTKNGDKVERAIFQSY